MQNVVVVGGGPAGMMSALQAARCGHHVTLLEHNEKLGKKLFISGKGRCNVTNDADILDFFQQIPRNPKFLYSALYGLTNDRMRERLHEWGVPTKVERGGRIFPCSDKSSDVIAAFSRQLKKESVRIQFRAHVTDILHRDGKISGVRLQTGQEMLADTVIIACGGMSYPQTGSTGNGYTLAKQCGHTITEIRPSLVPVQTVEAWPGQAQGLSLRNVKLTAYEGKKIIFQEQGEMLFTHYGVSGPLVLSCSAHIHDIENTMLCIDLKPALSIEKLEARIQREIEANGKRHYHNMMVELLPSKLIPIFVRLSEIPADKRAADLNRADRDAIVSLLKNMSMHIQAFRPIAEAIITRGGIDTKEVNPSTMESKKMKGLYFAGEVLDVDAYTGGFNLQIAFSTGYLAGQSIGNGGDQ